MWDICSPAIVLQICIKAFRHATRTTTRNIASPNTRWIFEAPGGTPPPWSVPSSVPPPAWPWPTVESRGLKSSKGSFSQNKDSHTAQSSPFSREHPSVRFLEPQLDPAPSASQSQATPPSHHLDPFTQQNGQSYCSRCLWRHWTSINSTRPGKLPLIRSQPLSLLLKASPLIDELALYDVVNTPGVAADLSHISSPAVWPHAMETTMIPKLKHT
jgi:hypothetical protein